MQFAVVPVSFGGVNYAVRARCARGAGRWGRGKTPGNGGVFFSVPRLLLLRGARAVRTLPQGMRKTWACAGCEVKTGTTALSPLPSIVGRGGSLERQSKTGILGWAAMETWAHLGRMKGVLEG